MTTAPAYDQQRLLDVQALDTRLTQLAHRRRSLPELARIEALRAERATRHAHLVGARTQVGDLERALRKAEGDVEQVRTRAARDQQRLDAGVGSAKDLQALQHEMVSLARRQGDLEDVELGIMEELEQAQGVLAGLQADEDASVQQEQEAGGTLGSATEVIDAEVAAVTAERDEVAGGLDAGLVALYDRVRASSGGLGAAALRQRRCDGCRLELPPSDLGRIRSAPAEEVLRCEECSRILVRVPESGL